MTQPPETRPVVPRQRQSRGGNAEINFYPIDTHPLDLAVWLDQVSLSLTGLRRGVQLIISIGSIRQAVRGQTIGGKEVFGDTGHKNKCRAQQPYATRGGETI